MQDIVETLTGPRGHCSYIDRGGYLDAVAKKYGRSPDRLCLKIFYREPIMGELETFTWCTGYPILDCTRIQNICHWRGLAPRVYAVDVINWRGKRVVVQLQDWAGETEGKNKVLFNRILGIVEEYGGIVKDKGDIKWNSAGGKWVDFQTFGWRKGMYRRRIKEKYGLR